MDTEESTIFTSEENFQTSEIIEYSSELQALNQIHEDLSILICFIVFFVIVIILKYSYKYFNMIFHF